MFGYQGAVAGEEYNNQNVGVSMVYRRRHSGNWNLKELFSLTSALNLPHPGVYTDSIAWRLDLADYHIHKCNDMVQKLHAPANIKSFRDLPKIFPEYEAHFVAAVESMNSAPEMLAQVINLNLIEPQPEGKVFFDRCLKLVIASHALSGIEQHLSGFCGSEEYKYVRAFANVCKHRRLADFKYNISVNQQQFRMGFKTKAFQYDDTRFEERWSEEVLAYAVHIKGSICDLGIDINNALKKKQGEVP